LGGAAPEMYDMIADGIVDGGWVIPGYEAGRFPEAEALELPFMTTKSAEEASAAAWEYTQEFLLDDFADIHLIAAHMHGPGLIHKRGPLIEEVEDFNGLTLRGPTRTATMLSEKLGATAVGMPVPAFPEALAKGVVDGGAITWEQSPSLKLDELTDSHSDVAGDHALYNLYFLWAMNQDVYDSLPEDLQAVIDANSGLYASRWAGYAHDTGDALGREIMAAANDIGEISEAETARMIALGDEVVAEWIAEMDAKGIDGAALVEAAQADVADAAGTKGEFEQR
jgi:TRAP-type C4-dicarboxylate transport system substrate-binding protein